MGKRNRLRKKAFALQSLVEQDGQSEPDDQAAEHEDDGEHHGVANVDVEPGVGEEVLVVVEAYPGVVREEAFPGTDGNSTGPRNETVDEYEQGEDRWRDQRYDRATLSLRIRNRLRGGRVSTLLPVSVRLTTPPRPKRVPSPGLLRGTEVWQVDQLLEPVAVSRRWRLRAVTSEAWKPATSRLARKAPERGVDLRLPRVVGDHTVGEAAGDIVGGPVVHGRLQVDAVQGYGRRHCGPESSP